MPAVSQAQRAYLAVHKGKAWMAEHGYDNKGKLPYKVGSKKTKPKPKARTKGAAMPAKKGAHKGAAHHKKMMHHHMKMAMHHAAMHGKHSAGGMHHAGHKKKAAHKGTHHKKHARKKSSY